MLTPHELELFSQALDSLPMPDGYIVYRLAHGQVTAGHVQDSNLAGNELAKLWDRDQHHLPSYWLFQKRDSRWFQWGDTRALFEGPISYWTAAQPYQVPKIVRTYHLLYV